MELLPERDRSAELLGGRPALALKAGRQCAGREPPAVPLELEPELAEDDQSVATDAIGGAADDLVPDDVNWQ